MPGRGPHHGARRRPDVERLAALDEDEELWLAQLLDRLPDELDLDAVTSLVYGVPKLARGLGLDDAPTEEVKADQKEFFGLLYRLLVDADRGPRLPTLILALGAETVRALLTPRAAERRWARARGSAAQPSSASYAVGLESRRNSEQRSHSSVSPIARADGGEQRRGSAGSRGWARAPTAPGRGPSSRCGAACRGCGGSRPGRRRRRSRRRRLRRGPARRSAAQANGEAGWRRTTSAGGAPPSSSAAPGSTGRWVGGRSGHQVLMWVMECIVHARVLTTVMTQPPTPRPPDAGHRGEGPVAGAVRALPRLLHDPGRLDDRLGGDAGDHRGPPRRRERRRLGDQRLPAGLRRPGADHRPARRPVRPQAALPRRADGLHARLAVVRADRHDRGADRRPRRAGPRRLDDHAADDGDHHPDLPGRPARRRRWRCGARPPASPRWSARSSAACSSTASAGSGSSSSTCRSAWSASSWPGGWCRR